jgi:hypothetical protein
MTSPGENPGRTSSELTMSLALFALLSLSNSAEAAAPDLTTSITAPASATVYASAMWQATVTNAGNRDAASVTLTVQLPTTNTSPSVYVMGTLGAKSASCVQSGTKLNCAVGTVRKYKSTTVYFYLALPESEGTLDFSTTATTTTYEPVTGNNGNTAVASLLYYSPVVTGTMDVTNRHCTGTGLEAFFECECFPSSISSHDATFNSDGSISFSFDPNYGGSWSVVGTELWFEYTELGTVVATFQGSGVDSLCWEGLTTFPGSSYVSPYEVCPL